MEVKQTKYYKKYKSVFYTKYNENNNEIYHYKLFYWKNTPKDVVIVDVYVQPEFRNLGYFYNIMKNALNNISKQNNIEMIYLSTFKNATIATQYEKYGFELYNDEDEKLNWYHKINEH